MHNRCVFVDQGKGVPDVNSRLMVRKLWDTLHIPIFALVDADPHGTHHPSECISVLPILTHTSHISTRLTTLDCLFNLRTHHTVGLHVPLSQQMLAPVRYVMVPSQTIISVGVSSSWRDGSISISLHTSNPFTIAWRDTYVMLYFVLSSVTHLRG